MGKNGEELYLECWKFHITLDLSIGACGNLKNHCVTKATDEKALRTDISEVIFQ